MTCCEVKLTPGQFHCAACCNTFGSLTLFDQHQVVKYEPPSLVCRDPRRMRGLVLHGGVWRTRAERDAIVAKLDAMHRGRAKGGVRQ